MPKQHAPNESAIANKRHAPSVRTAIDLFAGAGGFSLAAEMAGLKVLAAVELEKWAQETYRENFIRDRAQKDQHRLYGDIMDIEPCDMLHDVGVEKGELDILIGGPPCQGFSTHRIKGAGVDDPRNELLLRYFDFVSGLRPKTFLVENVSGMLWDRHAVYVERFKKLAEENGYQIATGHPQIINARDFGVPQNRKRVFILGIRSDIKVPTHFVWPPKPTHFSPNSKEVLESGSPAWLPASTVFKSPLKESDINNLHMKPGADMLRRFVQTPLNGGNRSNELPCHQEHDGHRDVYGRIDPSKPGPTMTTGCINPSRGRFVHPTEHHGITARHAARFQTFPDRFIFKGGLGHSGRQIGNAVPVDLAKYIIKYVFENILSAKVS